MAESTQTLPPSRVDPVPMFWSPAQACLERWTLLWQSKSYADFRVFASSMKCSLRRIWKLCVVAVVTIVFGDRIMEAQSEPPFAEETARQVIVTERALRHIEERHWPNSPAKGAGKFLQGITEDSLRELVGEAVANGQARPNTNRRSGQIYEYDFGRQIGITIDGGPASKLRVVLSPHNQLITAFPF